MLFPTSYRIYIEKRKKIHFYRAIFKAMIQGAITDLPAAAAHLIYNAHLRELTLSFCSFWFFCFFGFFFPLQLLSLYLVYSLLALLCVYVWLPWFLRGQTQNLSQGIRLVISRVVTFTSATQTSAVLDKRLIV